MKIKPFFTGCGVVVFGMFVISFLSGLFLSWTGQGGRVSDAPIHVIEVQGPILDSEEVLEKIAEVEKNKKIKGIVLRVNSPGGAVAPSQEILSRLLTIKKNKEIPIYASLSTLAASGGYYVALSSNKIFASPGTITGSIGVITQSVGIEKLLERFQIEPRVIKSGEYKDILNPTRSIQPHEKEFLQNFSDDVYEQFLEDVAQHRKLEMKDVREIANGKLYTGRQAKDLGLIDDLLDYHGVVDQMKEDLNLEKDAKVRWPTKKQPWETFFGVEWIHKALQILNLNLIVSYFPQWNTATL